LHLTIKKNRKKSGRFSIIPYCEFTLWSEPESRNIQWSLHLTRCFFEKGMIFYPLIEPHPAFNIHDNRDYIPERPGFAFMGINTEVSDFECVRDKFIGMYRSETNPEGAERGYLTGSILEGGIGCAALRTIISLKPDEERDIIVTLGFAESKSQALKIKGNYLTAVQVNKELKKVKESWEQYLSFLHLESLDENVNGMINVWNPYQCKTTFDWSRYISFYENGEGRGMGTRDSCQDALSVCCQVPDEVRKRIIQIITACQLESGDCYHQFFPLGQKGEFKGFSDDHLWLIPMVYYYIAETGDFSIMEEEVPYANSRKEDTVFHHLLASLKYTQNQTGPHGLPLILVADWNDTLHLWMDAQSPESVFTAALYVYAAKLFVSLALKAGDTGAAGIISGNIKQMTDRVNNLCWDGDWYLRGFGKTKIGTKKNKQAKIFLNSQAWCILSGIAEGKRAIKCMDSVREYLDTEEGLKLLWPCFESYDQKHGLISRYVKGRKENGIFSHANAWAVIAEAILKRADIAFDYYKKNLPAERNNSAEILKTEPYVYCQTICSDDSLNRGEGANSWLTGTASWMYIAFTQHILGIKPVLEGLMIDPCIPGKWQGYKATRVFRGCKYNIECIKSKNRRVLLDGQEIRGNVIPPQKAKECKVVVEIPS
jgi:cellobiose phosphorylase